MGEIIKQFIVFYISVVVLIIDKKHTNKTDNEQSRVWCWMLICQLCQQQLMNFIFLLFMFLQTVQRFTLN